jgi:hypothetical protein
MGIRIICGFVKPKSSSVSHIWTQLSRFGDEVGTSKGPGGGTRIRESLERSCQAIRTLSTPSLFDRVRIAITHALFSSVSHSGRGKLFARSYRLNQHLIPTVYRLLASSALTKELLAIVNPGETLTVPLGPRKLPCFKAGCMFMVLSTSRRQKSVLVGYGLLRNSLAAIGKSSSNAFISSV